MFYQIFVSAKYSLNQRLFTPLTMSPHDLALLLNLIYLLYR